MKISHKAFLLALPVFASLPAYASSETHHEVTVWTYAFPFINFFILAGLLFYFLRKPVKAMFVKRADGIRSGVEGAKALHDQALRQSQDIEAKLKNADQETRALIEGLKKSAAAERDQMLTASQALAQQLKADTQRLIEQEIRKAQTSLRQEAARIAADLASRQLEKGLAPDVAERLNTQFVQDLKTLPDASRGTA